MMHLCGEGCVKAAANANEKRVPPCSPFFGERGGAPPCYPSPDALSRMKRFPLRRAVSLANRSSEWVLLFFLLAASLPPLLFRHKSLVVASRLDLLDGS